MDLFGRLRRTKEDIEKEQQELQAMYEKANVERPPLLTPSLPVSPARPSVRRIVRRRRTQRKTAVRATSRTSPPRGKRKKSTISHQASSAKSFLAKHRKEHDLFREVLGDLNKELRLLRIQRLRLERQLKGYSEELGSTQNKEIDLRDKISGLMKKETAMIKRRSDAKDKIMLLTKRIEKMSAVGRQLREE